jgi:general secretion pathway protein L
MSSLSELVLAELSAADLWRGFCAGCGQARRWWLEEFRLLCPSSMLSWIGATGQPIVRLAPADNGVVVEITSTFGHSIRQTSIAWSDYTADTLDRELANAGLARGKTKLGIALPSAAFFHRSFDIPARAQDRVHALAPRELEHRTPFRADSVYLAMVFDKKPGAAGQLNVRQTIVRRDLVEAARHRLGLRLQDIAFAACSNTEAGRPGAMVPLHQETKSRTSSMIRLARAFGLVAVILAGVDFTLLWWAQERRLTEIETLAASEHGKAVAVRAIERDFDQLRASLRTLAEHRALPHAIDLWRETSRLLPDETWVTDWRLHGGSVSMAGFSSKATELVRLFEGSSAFKDAALDASITFDAVTGSERFSLLAHIRNPPINSDARTAQRQE